MMKAILDHKEIFFLLLLVVISTLLPHPANVTPIGALGLFAGTYIRQRGFLLLPVAAALFADLITVGVYSILIMFFVYSGHLLSALCGKFLLRGKPLTRRLPLAVIAASVCFYLVSNLGNWWVFMPHNWSGLVENYTLGLPYLLRTLVANALYATVFFGSFALLQKFLAREKAYAGA
jgi:hypothetical protein